MSTALWIISGLLALVYLAAGLMKLATPVEKLRSDPRMAWTQAFPTSFVRFLGTAETLGGLGLVLPAALGIATWLGGLAALGLAFIMIGAVVTHLRAKETGPALTAATILGLTAFLASQSTLF